MMKELDHLRLIFPDRPVDELERILSRHSYQVERAVDAILLLSEGAADTDNETTTLQMNHHHHHHTSSVAADTAQGGTIVNLPPPLAVATPLKHHLSSSSRHYHDTALPTIVSLPPPLPPSGPISTNSSTIVVSEPLPPQERQQQSLAAAERRLALQNAQQRAMKQEEQELQQALRDSLTPSHRGLDYISDDDLSRLMNDPVFLASLDANDARDLQEAITLQNKLEAAEAEWKQLYQSNQQQHRSSADLLSSSQFGKAAALQRQEIRQKLQASLVRARSSLGMATSQEEQLVQQLEAMNRENQEEQIRRNIRLQAKQAMLQAVSNHLDSFLLEHPRASYEQWIQELHPENAHEGPLLDGLDKTIDHRFYAEESEHLQMWNEKCCPKSEDNDNDSTRSSHTTTRRKAVQPRYSSAASRHDNADGANNILVVDLLSDETTPRVAEQASSSSSSYPHERNNNDKSSVVDPFFGLFGDETVQ